LLFTENDTNTARLLGVPNRTPYVKDGINNYIIHGGQDAVNAKQVGTKAAAHYPLTVGAGESKIIRLRLSDAPAASPDREDCRDSQLAKGFETFRTMAPVRAYSALR